MPETLTRRESLNVDAMLILEELTPGGSEFYQDPKRCAEWVRDRLSFTSKLAQRAKEAETKLEASEALNAELMRVMRWYAKGENAELEENGYVPEEGSSPICRDNGEKARDLFRELGIKNRG